MTVSREQFESCISELSGSVEEPRGGLFGPGSMSWQIGREGIVFLAGGAAALSQLAHPFVAYGVDEHSAAKADTLGRFLRTFEHVYAMLFGPVDRAVTASRRVFTIHERVTGVVREAAGRFAKGTRYEANDEDALLWVHATLVMNAVRAYELVLRPLSLAEKDRYVEENKRFALLFGIRPAQALSGWEAFSRYYDEMLRTGSIIVTPPAVKMARFLLAPPHPALGPAWRWYAMMTAGLLPKAIRDDLGLSFGTFDATAFETTVGALARLYPLLPDDVRFTPAYLEARRRLSYPADDPRGSGRSGSRGMAVHPMLKLLLRLRRMSARSSHV